MVESGVSSFSQKESVMRSLIKHVRDENRNPVATVVVIDNNGQLQSGVAVCNTKDHFHKRYGVEIATGRAIKNRGLDNIDCLNRRINWWGQEMSLNDAITEEHNRLVMRLTNGKRVD